MNESRRQLFHTKAKMRQVWPIILFLFNLERYLPTKLSGSAAAAQWCDLNVLVRGFVISDVAFLRAKPERRLNWTGRTANSKKASRIGRKVDPAVQILWNNYGGEKHYKLCKCMLTTNKFLKTVWWAITPWENDDLCLSSDVYHHRRGQTNFSLDKTYSIALSILIQVKNSRPLKS